MVLERNESNFSANISRCDNTWSEKTLQETRDVFESQNFMYPGDVVWLKHINNYSGYIELSDALNDHYKVTALNEPSDTKVYSSVEEMLEDGWAID